MEQIVTHNLGKSYRDVKAVDGLNLSISKGEIYGFLGLNGAGKTTTIRMLLGLIKPSGGTAYVNGVKVSTGNKDLWKKVGYLVETPHAYPKLTVFENLKLIAKLREIDEKRAVEKVMEILNLKKYANRPFKNLSLGNRQRLGLAKALVHQPEILILDEPSNGLDPEGIYDIRTMLIKLAEEMGVTIFVSSHILSEISMLATRIGIIHNGELIKELKTLNLPNLCKRKLVIETTDPKRDFTILEKLGYNNCTVESDSLIIKDQKAIGQRNKIARYLVDNQVDLMKLNIEQESLEQYFLRIIKQS